MVKSLDDMELDERREYMKKLVRDIRPAIDEMLTPILASIDESRHVLVQLRDAIRDARLTLGDCDIYNRVDRIQRELDRRVSELEDWKDRVQHRDEDEED